MKTIKTIICKISPAIIACFTLALSINANSSTCFVMYQPKAPAKLDEYKKIKCNYSAPHPKNLIDLT